MSLLATTGRHRRPCLAWRLATRRVMVGHGVIAGLFAIAFGLLTGWAVAQ